MNFDYTEWNEYVDFSDSPLIVWPGALSLPAAKWKREVVFLVSLYLYSYSALQLKGVFSSIEIAFVRYMLVYLFHHIVCRVQFVSYFIPKRGLESRSFFHHLVFCIPQDMHRFFHFCSLAAIVFDGILKKLETVLYGYWYGLKNRVSY